MRVLHVCVLRELTNAMLTRWPKAYEKIDKNIKYIYQYVVIFHHCLTYQDSIVNIVGQQDKLKQL